MTLPVPIPQPSYSQARENLVKAIPHKIICMLACGGRDCRYEGPACWRPSQQVIQGLFSSWVTDDIVAMARPSTYLINKYNIIEQFKRLNIKSIINMQLPGEHAYCGPPLDPESGFTYSPQTFMEHDIFFFNFGMPDFSVSSLVGMMDGVKVLAFAVKEGKVAVHCHAGLGRTGVLIACYLVYTLRISPSEAVQYVRIKRPRSIQTRAQISLVFEFARLLGTQLAQYPDVSLRHGAHFTLQLHLHRQALLLHGQEARTLRHIPKVVYLLCLRLSCLALGLPAQAEVHAELDRKAMVRALGWAVRETLVAKQYLPLLREVQRVSWLGSQSLTSVSSWDEPQGFLERKREVLLNKRSYSDSDLSKITDLELGSYYEPLSGTGRVWYGLDQIKPDLKPVSPDPATPSVGHCDNTEHAPKLHPTAGSGPNNNDHAKKSKCAAKKAMALPKFSSNIELRRTQHKSGQASVARAVAKAMADQNTPGEMVLQRAALIQEELNSSECGWALLVTESDPQVLSCLLWAWLEKLKDPVLSAENIGLLSSGVQCTNLHVLLKPQQHTISCLLGCVGQVTSLCPHREDAVLRRLMRALIRRPQVELESHAALMKIFKCNIRETLHSNNSLTQACNNTHHQAQ
ncbi:protein tyrosine phosphatase domain-containing protein 1 [Hypomesus transpacificus]|uniref:protein tyrosine phosphatase domain-containing protein 1 n=1 Tax=Hypomesus transpacificus TaxID=137520 RepID=UPI001F079C45|nr:protein tyrosine phosphatase domain-containing protein 1 [Hypomesus transpacificus]